MTVQSLSPVSIAMGLLCLALPSFAQVRGNSVNMVSGTQWPGGDPFLQRQNEPSMAISSRNSLHILAGANDYRTVDLPGVTSGEPTGDAWLGVFKSFDGGNTWTSFLLPGFPQDTSPEGLASPLKAYSAGADPNVRAGTNGMFYFSGLAFTRTDPKLSRIFVARYIDDNNLEGGDTIRYLGTSVLSTGNYRKFFDKPAIAVDLPRAGTATCTLPGSPAQSFAAGNIYAAWAEFEDTDDEPDAPASLLFSRSTDCGETWSPYIYISRLTLINQGAAIAIDPATGNVFVVWRVFASHRDSNSIWYTVSTDGGRTFSLPKQITTIQPFDQGTTSLSFRTNAYPVIAADGSGSVHVAWSQRGIGPATDARIVITTGQLTGNTVTWAPPAAVDPTNQRGHQIIPAITFAAGKLTVAWHDFRNDGMRRVYTPTGGGQYSESLVPDGTPVFDDFIQDPAAPYNPNSRRHTADIRAAQSTGYPLNFGPSILVSQYAFGTPAGTPADVIEQLQFNPPNLPMFQQGTVPFFGDYIDLAGQTFIPTSNGNWRFNTAATDPDFTRAVWTDNRDVVQPADGDWTHYTPVGVTSGPSLFDPSQQRPACAPGQTGMRNQNIYTASITPGVIVDAKGNAKPLGFDPANPSQLLQRAFPITVQNTTGQTRTYRLTLPTQPIGGKASFLQNALSGLPDPLTKIDVQINPYSSTSRPVFVTSTDPRATIPVNAVEIDTPNGVPVPNGLSGSVTMNTDVSNPNISNPNISNAEIYNPNISNPNISNPNISNPNISNPNISNPNISNTDVANPNISNPNISNPNISNTAINDATWTVSNDGNTAASYTLKLLENIHAPAGVTIQLIVSQSYTTPVAQGCNLSVKVAYVPLGNVPDVVFDNPSDLFEPAALDPAASTFTLLPGEEALITIRAYDSTTSDPAAALAHYNPALAVQPVIIAPGVNTGGSQPQLTLAIISGQLPQAVVGTAYQQSLSAVGGAGNYVWSLESGTLPNTLTLTPAGVIQGTPTAPATLNFTVRVTDQNGKYAIRPYTLVIGPGPLYLVNLQIQRGGYRPILNLPYTFAQTLTITNDTGAAIPAPIYVVLEALLPSGVTLYNQTGVIAYNNLVVAGSPYLKALDTGALQPGQQLQVALQFATPPVISGSITYDTKVLYGPGAP